MLAGTRHHQSRARRGIVLVLVLAMLGLLALIGVTFATFAGQARINARNFAQSVIQPQDDELMDFALQQLITDTGDIRSAIRGHSLARDMFGNDGYNNGYLAVNPLNGASLTIQNVQLSTNVAGAYDVLTTLQLPQNNNPALYGYNFTRWVMKIYLNPNVTGISPLPVGQTCEILIDYNASGGTTPVADGQHFAFCVSPLDSALSSYNPPTMPNNQTVLNNPTLGWTVNSGNTFPGWTSGNPAQLALTYAHNAGSYGNFVFTLDGRWLRAFNGPGLGTQFSSPFNFTWSTSQGVNYNIPNYSVPLSTYGNFRFNGLNPNTVGMDEDYDACDLENWFLAIQSADGQVMIPSFHRPGVVRYQDNTVVAGGLTPNKFDWDPAFRNQSPSMWTDSASRVLRPVAADGHDAVTFPDLLPDPSTGKITYDVDNDGDGVTDSVWVDLGYPSRRDATGNIFKPMFAFMVIGLNGRIPLNTAGNLAGNGATHAQHLGNSVSEIDPTYGLQNAFIYGSDIDPFNQLGSPTNGIVFSGPSGNYPTYNSQVDNAIAFTSGNYQSVDVRLTQIRNLLSGTRPQVNPFNPDTTGQSNGDTNFVWGSFPGHGAGTTYALPNGTADANDVPSGYTFTDANGNSYPLIQRTTPPVGGRWGEATSIAGVPFPNPNSATTPLNMVQPNYVNPPRAGYSFDIADLVNAIGQGTVPYDSNGDPIFPRDAADDNYNAFDVWPPPSTTTNRVGEVYDQDFYDAAGALVLPVERFRRFVTPIDINGTGRVQTFGGTSDFGPDNLGRVQFSSYHRPAGIAGPINVAVNSSSYPYGAIAPPAAGGYSIWSSSGMPTLITSGETYVPDVTNNPLHGYEWYKIPNTNQVMGATTPPASYTYNAAGLGGMPIGGANTQGAPPTLFPTYDSTTNSSQRLDGVNEADEMNLYTLNPLLDSPYGPADLEWLYRQQDVDGGHMTSRLSQLAPVSFTNTIDGQRRRRLYALHSTESNSFVWTNDNPPALGLPNGVFANNARFSPLNPTGVVGLATGTAATTANATFANINAYGPSLIHRDKKINLNYPLPVSNDPNEPIRQKWINDTYHLLRLILPPTSVDSPEELAQLSQFVINIIDFRDPDCTMTHWQNPDVVLNPGAPVAIPGGSGPLTYYYTPPNLAMVGSAAVGTNAVPLDQFGMEYNPVAINEVLAYGFQTRTGPAPGAAIYTNRFFIELVNTLTAAYNPQFSTAAPTVYAQNNYYGYGPIPGATSTSPTGGNITSPSTPPYQASTLDLGGFNYTQYDPYSGGCWDLVFTADNAMARPDPFRGELVYNANAAAANIYTIFGLIPLNRDSFPNNPTGSVVPNTAAPNDGDVTLLPLSPTASNVVGGIVTGNTSTNLFNPPTAQPAGVPPVSYFYVIGSPPNSTVSGASTNTYEINPIAVSSNQYSCVTQYLNSTTTTPPYSFDPMNPTVPAPTIVYHPGVLPAPTTTTQFGGLPGTTGTTTSSVPNFLWKLPVFGNTGTSLPAPPANGTATYYWVCLRRPANPFAPVSATNPMCVVDSMRFPYIDGTANVGNSWPYANPPTNTILTPVTNGSVNANTIFSAQRLQPYRGGHAVPMPNAPYAPSTIATTMPPDPRYGYSEQIATPFGTTQSGGNGTYGLANPSGTSTQYASTNLIFHTLGYNNDSAENWDYLVFNDRDFSSVAELMLVPGCPPGLFTKQFVEFAPSQMTAANIFSAVTPVVTPTFVAGFNGSPIQVQPPAYISTPSTVPVAPTNMPTPFSTATVSFLDVSQATVNSQLGSSPSGALTAYVPTYNTSNQTYGIIYQNGFVQPTTGINQPVQPHAFPYLVDKFFYTGASTFYYPPSQAALDPGSLTNGAAAIPTVGGPGGDGWFKMLEFFEVPSQSIGAYGPVAQGVNFDWARQDSKPGLMNLNLIIDEEAFYSIFGRQSTSGFNQSLLNSIELPLLANINNNGQLVLPYSMPLVTANNGNPPILLGGPPVPLVVSAIQPTGAPNYVYPVTDQTQYIQHGYTAEDPIQVALNTANQVTPGLTLPTGGVVPTAIGNRIKAAFAQFLWLRHGGSGYIFGFGNGSTGQNSAVGTPNLANVGYGSAIPADRPFRSLSYPDINSTIMRPATLPPSTFSNPTLVNSAPATNAAVLYNQQTPAAAATGGTAPPYFGMAVAGSNPQFYSPFIVANATGFEGLANSPPIVYTGDPGVRNPFLNQGYVTGAQTSPTAPASPGASPYTLYAASTPYAANPAPGTSFILPAGVPIPTNVAFPPSGATSPIPTDSIQLPPPIPPARLFQSPDYFGAHQIHTRGYTGINETNTPGTGTVPPALSNATDSGDPWINNTVANQLLNPWSVANDGTGVPFSSYTLNHGFASLLWGGGSFYSSAVSNASPLLTGTGVLPTTYVTYPPYLAASPSGTPGRLSLNNSTTGSPPGNLHTPYLGGNTTSGTNTDDRQHPYWRSELMQKAMNLTTVRTHQYAVWITIGFFSVLRQGDLGMLGQGAPQLAFDLIGHEIGALDGQSVRYRGFFLIDRLQLTGFNPGNIGSFRAAVLYRVMIQ